MTQVDLITDSIDAAPAPDAGAPAATDGGGDSESPFPPQETVVEGPILASSAIAAEPDAVAPLPVMQMAPTWRGVLVVEDAATGDGREFAADSLLWVDPPLPFRWQIEDSHGGMPTNKTVNVGSITRVWRDGNKIMGEGVFDLGGPTDDHAHEAARRVETGTLYGVSIDADDITDADIEYVFDDPDGESEEDDVLMLLFAKPKKVIFHAARIRAATLCDIPAFVEAKIAMVPAAEQEEAANAEVIELTHSTPTSDAAWDGAEVEAALGVISTDRAREFYAFVLPAYDGDDARYAARFLHHDLEGNANLTACSAAVSQLNHDHTLARVDRRRAYDHLARHLRDAELEPPPFEDDALVAAAWQDQAWHPPRDWFSNPNIGQYVPIMVKDDGRVYGYAAQWGDCHIGFMNECVMPPREDYHSYFRTGELTCDDGTVVAVGQITAGIEHAPLPWRAAKAKEHYENTKAVVCDVATGCDSIGIWVAGAIRPWAETSRVHALRASGQVSPDWRRIGGELRLVGLLTVNTSGFQVPRSRTFVASGQVQALVASGFVSVKPTAGPTEEELNKRALQLLRKQLNARVHPEES